MLQIPRIGAPKCCGKILFLQALLLTTITVLASCLAAQELPFSEPALMVEPDSVAPVPDFLRNDRIRRANHTPVVAQDHSHHDSAVHGDRRVSQCLNSDTSTRLRVNDIFPLFTGDASLSRVPPVSGETNNHGLMFFLDYNSFMDVPDGGWTNNGLSTGLNYATRLGDLSDITGIGLQIGGSVGVYDWAGTDYRTKNNERAETQGFFTYGLYRKPSESSPMSAGIVQDWEFNNTFGVFAQNPTLSQLRGQLGYATSASNEFGIWGAAHVLSASQSVPGFAPITFEPISHLSGFWHHKWYAHGPDTWISVGAPSRGRLSGNGSVGDYLVSATANCPLSDAVSITSSVTYMHPSSSPGRSAARDEMWNFIVGITIYPGRNARSATVAGDRWMPLLSVANNGSFLVDASRNSRRP